MWAEAAPNLLIGLREGLEAGLVVSILLAAVKRDVRASTAPVWLGVLVAVVLAMSFGAVLTYSESALSTVAQEAFAGGLSVVAVILVTTMIFWMRRTARGLRGELTAKVDSALQVGAGALALTAFLAVGREGLETALFLWTTVQASGHTVAPLLGALVGVGIAVGLCWLLYRRAIRINLGVFFSRTAVALVVIAAGVLAYGLGDLQDAGVLPGRNALAFDLSSKVSLDTWWVAIVSGVTNLRPSMTWLQVGAYLGYLALYVLLASLADQGRMGVVRSLPRPHLPLIGGVGRWWVAAALVVPVAAAGVFIAIRPRQTDAGREVRITAEACAPGWRPGGAGAQTFAIVNDSRHSGEIYLYQPATGGIVGELEGLGPGTRQSLPVTLGAGDYAWRCVMAGQPVRISAVAHASGSGTAAAAAPVLPVSTQDLQPAVDAYRTYVSAKLAQLAAQVATLRRTVSRTAWLAAQLTWEQIGAAYGSFGDLGDAIDGLPNGLPQGVDDPGFTGLHRIEYGLWHGQGTTVLLPIVDKLATDVATLRAKLPTVTVDPTDLPLRAHEILEDALRDHLTGMTDFGSHAGYAETLADLQGTRVVLGELAPLVNARRPGLLPAANREMETLQQALTAAKDTSLPTRQKVDAATGALLETLAPIPDLLEVRK
jgi:high-affinity iron transporter